MGLIEKSGNMRVLSLYFYIQSAETLVFFFSSILPCVVQTENRPTCCHILNQIEIQTVSRTDPNGTETFANSRVAFAFWSSTLLMHTTCGVATTFLVGSKIKFLLLFALLCKPQLRSTLNIPAGIQGKYKFMEWINFFQFSD